MKNKIEFKVGTIVRFADDESSLIKKGEKFEIKSVREDLIELTEHDDVFFLNKHFEIIQYIPYKVGDRVKCIQSRDLCHQVGEEFVITCVDEFGIGFASKYPLIEIDEDVKSIKKGKKTYWNGNDFELTTNPGKNPYNLINIQRNSYINVVKPKARKKKK